MKYLLLAFLALGAVAQAAPTVTVSINPATGVAPYSATLTWSSTGAVSCAASDGWTGSRGLSGTQAVTVPVAGAKYVLTCTAADGAANLTWTAPDKNTNGSSLTDLSGYNLYRGTSATNLTRIRSLGPSLTSTVDDNLASGTYFWSLTSVNQANLESARSNPVSVAVTGSSASGSATAAVQTIPNAPTNVSVTEVTAYEIRPNSTGTLVASRVGVIPLGSLCSAETRKAGNVTYHRVDPQVVDLVNWPASKPIQAWAQCG
jgi:hypothetical protein